MEKIKCVISENGTIIPIHNIAKISNVNRVWSNADAEDNLGHKLSDEQYNALLRELEIIGGDSSRVRWNNRSRINIF